MADNLAYVLCTLKSEFRSIWRSSVPICRIEASRRN